MTCLSTVEEEDARFSRRRALVRCSFSITAGTTISMTDKKGELLRMRIRPSCLVFPRRADFSLTSASKGFNRSNSLKFSSSRPYQQLPNASSKTIHIIA